MVYCPQCERDVLSKCGDLACMADDYTQPTIRVKKNIYGNYVCFIGTERVTDFGSEFDVKFWLYGKLLTSRYKLSPKSDLQRVDIECMKDLYEPQ